MWNCFLRNPGQEIKLSPVSPKEPTGKMGCFESVGSFSISPGWCLVKVSAVKDIADPFLIIDKGLGFEETHKYHLNCINHQLAPSVFPLPGNIQKIRLYLKGNAPDELTVDFIPISRFEAFIRVGLYLYRLNKLRGISPLQVLQEKWHQIRKAGIFNVFRDLEAFYDYGDTTRPIGYLQWIEKIERYDEVLESLSYTSSAIQSQSRVFVFVLFRKGCNLQKTIDSLKQQIHRNWRLLVLYGENTSLSGKDLISSHETDDPRITFLNIAPESCSEEIIASCLQNQHDYFMMMNAGDVLPPLALYFFLAATQEHKEGILFYCDSDFLDKNDERITPHFRPSWNRELFYSQDYIANCCMLNVSVLANKPGRFLLHEFPIYEIILELIEEGCEEKIVHIPKVLYHKKPLKEGDAARTNRIDILERHFERLGRNYLIAPGLLKHTLKIEYPLPDPPPTITLIIPTRDNLDVLKKCISSILKYTCYPFYDIVIVDNNSQKPRTLSNLKKLDSLESIRVIRYPHPFNYAAINNYAARKTQADLICLLNDDVEIFTGDWLEEMARIAVRKEIGCVGAKLLYSNGKIQHAGIICGLGDVGGHAHRYFNRNDAGYFGRLQSTQFYSAVTAACLLVRRKLYLEIGGMDEFLAVAYNDVDFCLKLKQAGYNNVYTPYAELYHHESLSRGPEDTPEKKERYQREVEYMKRYWKQELDDDPYYNPNLSRLREDFSL